MSKFSNNRTLAACLIAAILSTVIFAISRGVVAVSPPRPSVKVTYQSSYVLATGEVKLGTVLVRTLSKGQMRRQEYKDGKLHIDQFIDADGKLYGVSHQRRELNPAEFDGRFDLKTPPPTAEYLMAQKQFNRTEQILGRTAYVFQIRMEDGTLVKELWRSPETDPLTLKEISYRDDGSRSVIEATSVEIGNAGEVKPKGYIVK
jgi:hypothetical protein